MEKQKFQNFGRNTNEEINSHVIVMVGVPARGKSFTSKKLSYYLNWIGLNTKIFNLGDYRRLIMDDGYSKQDFFSSDNEEGVAIRQLCAVRALDDACLWLKDTDNIVAIYDGTNSTFDRRKFLYDTIVVENKYELFFIESICDDDEIIEETIKNVKSKGEDYTKMSEKEAAEDFRLRIEHYQLRYNPIDEKLEKHFSFIKIINVNIKYIVYNVKETLQLRLVNFLMNLDISKKNVFLTCHGENEYDFLHLFGGDSDLSQQGKMYAISLNKYLTSERARKLECWTSTMKCSIQTASDIKVPQEHWRALNEIDFGLWNGKCTHVIEEECPNEFKSWVEDKFNFPYPLGESYNDLVYRLEPVIFELERLNHDILIVTHKSVVRSFLGYFLKLLPTDIPTLDVPFNTIFKLTQSLEGDWIQDTIEIPINC